MFEKLRKEYKKFTYEKYDINETFSEIIITYYFNIDGKEKFNPTLKFSKSIIKNNNIDKDFFNYLVFHIGLIELISYWKCICPKEVEVSAGYIDHEQIEWFKKLYSSGLEIKINQLETIPIPDLTDSQFSTINSQLTSLADKMLTLNETLKKKKTKWEKR